MSDLGELLDNLDMESYLSIEGVDFKSTRGRSGDQLNVKECPVCGNSDYKVYLNAETGVGNCFAGSHPPGENFSKWSFIKARLGAKHGYEVVNHIKQISTELGWQPKREARAIVVPPELKIPDSIPLPYNGQNLTYLTKRGISKEITEQFGLRYAQQGWFKYEFRGEEKYQRWTERMIVPIFDLDGKMVSFQGRDISGTAEKKYLFPPGLPSTGKHLLNGHNAIGAKSIVIGEGVFDVMAMKMAFDADVTTRHLVAVGSFGKHLSMGNGDDQLSALLRLKKEGLVEIVFMWDSEPAALAAAVEAGTALNSYGFKTRLAILPAGRDPNEVPGDVVRAAYWAARAINPSLLVRIKMGMVM